jgi:hypothetical protein
VEAPLSLADQLDAVYEDIREECRRQAEGSGEAGYQFAWADERPEILEIEGQPVALIPAQVTMTQDGAPFESECRLVALHINDAWHPSGVCLLGPAEKARAEMERLWTTWKQVFGNEQA